MGTVGKMINIADSHLQYLSGVTEVRFASAQTAHIWHSGVWLTPAADTGSFSKPSLLIIIWDILPASLMMGAKDL